MKNELKQLYRKDRELALKVAKVLGYKIKAAKDDKPVAKNQKTAEKSWLREIRDDIKHIGVMINSFKAPDNFDAMASYLKDIRESSMLISKAEKKLDKVKFIKR